MEENRNQLIRDISHDLKNPLMGIQGYAELCMGKEDITQQQMQDYLELIRNNSIRANELLMNLFDYAKLESADFVLKREKVDFGEFLRQELIAWIPELENKHFSYEADIPEQALDVMIDVAQMKRVFSNLFGNAIKYNPDGTSIFLAVREVLGKCEIVFSDSGIGMDEEYAKTLFEPFSRPDNQVHIEKIATWQTASDFIGYRVGNCIMAVLLSILTLVGIVTTRKEKEKGGCLYRIYAIVLLLLLCFATGWGLFTVID